MVDRMQRYRLLRDLLGTGGAWFASPWSCTLIGFPISSRCMAARCGPAEARSRGRFEDMVRVSARLSSMSQHKSVGEHVQLLPVRADHVNVLATVVKVQPPRQRMHHRGYVRLDVGAEQRSRG